MASVNNSLKLSCPGAGICQIHKLTPVEFQGLCSLKRKPLIHNCLHCVRFSLNQERSLNEIDEGTMDHNYCKEIECIFFLFRLILICTSSYFGIKMLEKSYPTPLAMLRRIGSPLLPRETVVVPAAAASAYDCFLVCKSKK